MNKEQKIYLAGGMKSGWQNKVKQNKSFVFYDPAIDKNNDNMDVYSYGAWDLFYVKKCDILFAYMERENPSGIGMAVEMGYAKAIGKTIILCLEKDNKYKSDKSLDFLRIVADVVFENINDAINYLKNYE